MNFLLSASRIRSCPQKAKPNDPTSEPISSSPLFSVLLFLVLLPSSVPETSGLEREVVSCCDGRGMLRRDDIEVVVVSGFGQDEQFGVGSPFLLR